MLLSLLQSINKMLTKMHLIPVIQLEKQNCETTSQVNSEAAVAFAWVRRLQNTPKFHKPPWGCQDIQQNVSKKGIWFQSFNLKSKTARQNCKFILRRRSHLPECTLFKTLSNFKNKHAVIEIYSTKCVGQNASGSSHPTWKAKLRDNIASKFWGGRCICLSKASSKHSKILQTAMRLSRYPTKCVGHNGFSKSSRSIWISAWWICCSFLATTIQHLAFFPSHCFSNMLVTV